MAYATFPGQFGGENVTWELGIWWAHPSDGTEVAVYVECVEAPERLRKKTWARQPKTAGGWLPFSGGIHLVVDPGQDVDKAFKKLIDEVADQSDSAKGR